MIPQDDGAAALFRWSTGNIQAPEKENVHFLDSPELPPALQQALTGNISTGSMQWLCFCWEGMCSRRSSTSSFCSHRAGLTQVAVTEQHSSLALFCGSHILEICPGITPGEAMARQLCHLGFGWSMQLALQSYRAAFSEFWNTKQESGSHFQVNCIYSSKLISLIISHK